MREILFRAKPAKIGPYLEKNPDFIHDGFIHGYLGFRDGVYSIIPKETSDDVVIRPSVRVITETIGQFTGLTDKNGKKIFEGDMVLWDGEYKYEVYYDVDYCGFFIRGFINERYEQGPLGLLSSDYMDIIGNIHDNPELVEVKNHEHG